MPSMDQADDWAARRQAEVRARSDALARERAAETAQARQLLARFVRDMTERGIPPQRLRARVADTRTTYRTPLTGWYLRRNGTVAVGVDAEYYLLDTPRSLRGRLLGVRPRPAEPGLRIGVGARDGESMTLEQALRQRLEAGREWHTISR